MNTRIKRPGHSAINDSIMRSINELVNRKISCALRVHGHSYWWVLEYGSGLFGEKARTKRSQPHQRGPVMIPPKGIKVVDPKKQKYEIPAVEHKNKFGYLSLFFLWKNPPPIKGKWPKGWKFKDRGEGLWMGDRPALPSINHPGVHAIGFVRAAVRQFYKDLSTGLRALKKDKSRQRKGIPTRKALVELVNDCLVDLWKTVIDNTPESKDLDWRENPEGPLADAWRVTKAR